MKYIQNQEPPSGCVFCQAAAQNLDAENLVIKRARQAFVILNRYPYTSGHLMVIPYMHVPSIEDLNPETRQEMMELVNLSMTVLRTVYQPEGFNLGANIGAAAGAGIADHVHMHVVPRWVGDTNFMTAIGGTRILPESLEDTYRRIHDQWP